MSWRQATGSLFRQTALTLALALFLLLVKRLILVPIANITELAKAVSKGDIGREVVVHRRNVEIVDLANTFELMRRSLLTAMKRMKRKA